MRRLVIGPGVVTHACVLAINREIAVPLVDTGSEPGAPLRQQAILTVEAPAADGQLIDRFLNAFDLMGPARSIRLMSFFLLV